MNRDVKRLYWRDGIFSLTTRINVLFIFPLSVIQLLKVNYLEFSLLLVLMTTLSFFLTFKRRRVYRLVYTSEATEEDKLEGTRYIDPSSGVLFNWSRIFLALVGLNLALYEMLNYFKDGLSSVLLASVGVMIFVTLSSARGAEKSGYPPLTLTNTLFVLGYAYIVSIIEQGGFDGIKANLLTMSLVYIMLVYCLNRVVISETKLRGIKSCLTVFILSIIIIFFLVGLTLTQLYSYIFYLFAFVLQISLVFVFWSKSQIRLTFFS